MFLMPDGVSKTVMKLSRWLEVHRSVLSTMHANGEPYTRAHLECQKETGEKTSNVPAAVCPLNISS